MEFISAKCSPGVPNTCVISPFGFFSPDSQPVIFTTTFCPSLAWFILSSGIKISVGILALSGVTNAYSFEIAIVPLYEVFSLDTTDRMRPSGRVWFEVSLTATLTISPCSALFVLSFETKISCSESGEIIYAVPEDFISTFPVIILPSFCLSFFPGLYGFLPWCVLLISYRR